MNITSSNPPRVEVLTTPERRRRWAPAEKSAMVEETNAPGLSVSYVARKHGMSPSQLFNWRRAYEEGAMSGIEAEDKVVPVAEVKKLPERIRRLKTRIGMNLTKSAGSRLCANTTGGSLGNLTWQLMECYSKQFNQDWPNSRFFRSLANI